MMILKFLIDLGAFWENHFLYLQNFFLENRPQLSTIITLSIILKFKFKLHVSLFCSALIVSAISFIKRIWI